MLYVIRNGGSDHQIAPSKVVNVHTKKGIVHGVFGWPAIHTRSRVKEEPPKPDNICIDIGAKDKELTDQKKESQEYIDISNDRLTDLLSRLSLVN